MLGMTRSERIEEPRNLMEDEMRQTTSRGRENQRIVRLNGLREAALFRNGGGG